jgi:hypothetical protein
MKGKTNFNNYKLTNLKTNNIKLYNSIRDIAKDIGLNIYTCEVINKINDGKLQRKSHVAEKYLLILKVNKLVIKKLIF